MKFWVMGKSLTCFVFLGVTEISQIFKIFVYIQVVLLEVFLEPFE